MMESASSTRHKKETILCPFFKMVTFLGFDVVAAENAIFHWKRRQFVFKLTQQIKNERIR